MISAKKLLPVSVFAIFLVFLVFSVSVIDVASCATEISGPTTAVVLIPQTYTVKGANASHTYKVELTDPNGNTETVLSSIKPSSDGEFSFTVSFDEAGTWQITVTSNTDSNDKATISVNVTDILALILPIVVLILIITVFMSFASKIRF